MSYIAKHGSVTIALTKKNRIYTSEIQADPDMFAFYVRMAKRNKVLNSLEPLKRESMKHLTSSLEDQLDALENLMYANKELTSIEKYLKPALVEFFGDMEKAINGIIEAYNDTETIEEWEAVLTGKAAVPGSELSAGKFTAKLEATTEEATLTVNLGGLSKDLINFVNWLAQVEHVGRIVSNPKGKQFMELAALLRESHDEALLGNDALELVDGIASLLEQAAKKLTAKR